MRTIVLYEDESFVDLLPLAMWRFVFELRLGRRSLMDRLAQGLGASLAGVWVRPWMARLAGPRCGAPCNEPVPAGTVLVNGRWVLDEPFKLPKEPCQGVVDGTTVFAVCDAETARQLDPRDLIDAQRSKLALMTLKRVPAPGWLVRRPWDLITRLGQSLENDWKSAEAGFESTPDKRVFVNERERIHVGANTRIHPTACLDAAKGPLFISHDVSIGAHAVIEGPAYIGPGTTINPHAWLHGANAIGPVCKVGGEIDGCLIDGYSNKQHAGFLGHAYVGSWVNIGAGACNSDLKNTYGKIRVPINGRDVDTELQFFGAVIADHVKIGINASVPTGAAIGMASMIGATRVIPKYIPSFSWVTDDRVGAGDPMRLLDVACAAMARRNVEMTDDEVELFIEMGTIAKEFEARAPRSTS